MYLVSWLQGRPLLTHACARDTRTLTGKSGSVSCGAKLLIVKWVAITFSRGSSQPGDLTQVSHIAGEFFASHQESP